MGGKNTFGQQFVGEKGGGTRGARSREGGYGEISPEWQKRMVVPEVRI